MGLARLEATTVLTALLDQVQSFRLGTPVRKVHNLIRAFDSLPIEVMKAERGTASSHQTAVRGEYRALTIHGSDSCEVAIVGLGPVGSVLAILLGQLGHEVIVLERWPRAYPLPRAVHFDDEVARILQACGIGATLGEITEQPDIYEWRNASGQTLLRFGLSGRGLSGWPSGSMFHQPQLEAVLADRISSLPNVQVRRGAEYTAAVQDDGGVTIDFDHVDVTRGPSGGPQAEQTGEHDQIRARFLVGCDGSNSNVRQSLDFAVTDLGFFYDWFIVDVVLHEPREFHPTNLQVCDPARPTTVVSGGPGRRRWEFMRLPSESIEDFSDAAAAWRLLEPWDVTPDNARLERHALYTFQARWVEALRAGRVMLAGDAAHQMPPFAGQGMCAGIRDAANLAWKLDLVLHGQSPDSLLDLYGLERRPSVESAIRLSMQLGQVICVPDPAAAQARDEAMIRDVIEGQMAQLPALPGIAEGVRLDDDVLAGELFLQAQVVANGQAALFDDHVGAGWRLVTVDSACTRSIDQDLIRWFADIGGRVIVIGEEGDVQDIDGVYAAWFDRHRVTVDLQRPDFLIFGSGNDFTAARRLLRTARRALGIDDLSDALTTQESKNT